MTLRHLRIFVSICETGSTTAAAEQLYLAQPSISLALSELESHYNVKLFDRIGRRLQITQAGQLFLSHASNIVMLYNIMEEEMKHTEYKGIIRVGASATIGAYFLPKYLDIFKEKYPHVQVILDIDYAFEIGQNVLENKIDFGLIELNFQNEKLISREFHSDELVGVCSPHHPFANKKDITIEALTKEKILLWRSKETNGSIMELIFKENGYTLYPIWKSFSTSAILEGVKRDLGISFLSRVMIEQPLASHEVAIFSLDKYDLKRNFTVIYQKKREITPLMRDFLDLFCNQKKRQTE